MTSKTDRIYTVTAQLRIAIKFSSLIAEADESVAAAVRQRLRLALMASAHNGMRFSPGHVDVEVKKLEEPTNE
jgi:hypothetical protein